MNELDIQTIFPFLVLFVVALAAGTFAAFYFEAKRRPTELFQITEQTLSNGELRFVAWKNVDTDSINPHWVVIDENLATFGEAVEAINKAY